MAGKNSLAPVSFFSNGAVTPAAISFVQGGVTGSTVFADGTGGTCQAGTPIAVMTTCTVNASFAPTSLGNANGAVVLFDAAGNPLATTFISGSAQAPAVSFDPGVQSTIGSGYKRPSAIALDGAGNVFIADPGKACLLHRS